MNSYIFDLDKDISQGEQWVLDTKLAAARLDMFNHIKFWLNESVDNEEVKSLLLGELREVFHITVGKLDPSKFITQDDKMLRSGS